MSVIQPGWDVLDNNLLACPRQHVEAVLDMLDEQPRAARFTGGIDARLCRPWFARRLGRMRVQILYNDAEHPCARVIDEDVTKLETCAAGFDSVPLLWLQAGEAEETVWGLVRVGRHDSAYLQAAVPPDDAVSLRLAPEEGVAGEVYLSGDPYGSEDAGKIIRVVAIEEDGVIRRIEFRHNTLAARSATPAYQVPYKDHAGNNRLLAVQCG